MQLKDYWQVTGCACSPGLSSISPFSNAVGGNQPTLLLIGMQVMKMGIIRWWVRYNRKEVILLRKSERGTRGLSAWRRKVIVFSYSVSPFTTYRRGPLMFEELTLFYISIGADMKSFNRRPWPQFREATKIIRDILIFSGPSVNSATIYLQPNAPCSPAGATNKAQVVTSSAVDERSRIQYHECSLWAWDYLEDYIEFYSIIAKYRCLVLL